MKSGRQGTILRIISEQSIETQNQLMDELKKRGIDTTQATLSRDIRELRLVKQRSADGTSRYAAAGLVGSLSGNDTVFLAMRDNAAAETLAREGRSLFMG